jgi:hypothetical protein
MLSSGKEKWQRSGKQTSDMAKENGNENEMENGIYIA